MQEPAIPRNEDERLQALRDLDILDTATEERFDRITRLAARLIGVPISLVSLVDAERQWFKSHYGLDATETPRSASFCAHTVPTGQPLVVPNALEDERFHDNPLVTGNPDIRFYAGVPLRGPEGHNLGTFCVIDREPRTLTDEQLAVLKDLAAMAQAEIHDVRVRKAQQAEQAKRLELAAKEQEMAALKRLDQERRTFINGAAHAFRTPLTPLRTQVETLKVRLRDDPKTVRATERIDRQIRHLTHLVDRMQTVAALQSGQVPGNPEPTLAHPIVRATVDDVVQALDNGHAAAHVDVPDDVVVAVDPEHLQIILAEIVRNAYQASPDEGQVRIVATQEPGRTLIRVVDEGDGPPQDQSQWFRGFGEEDNTRLIADGAGFGLTIARGYAALYGGTLELRPGPDGRGTEARLAFPDRDEPASNPAQEPATPVAPGPH